MVLLIGNYAPDQQQSMQRFTQMMLRELRALDLPAKVLRPQPWLIRFLRLRVLNKWIGYFDKYVIFPLRLRAAVSRAQIVHICDHSNAVYTSHFRNVPVVVTCHDLLAVRGALGDETDCPASITGKLLQRCILSGLRRAGAIACVSHATAADAKRLLASAPKPPRISVIENGLNYDFQTLEEGEIIRRLAPVQRLKLDRPFVLHVGSNLRRKNRDGVLRIFASTKEQWNAQLVFAGESITADLSAMALQLGMTHRVISIVSPESELLEALYNRAHALLFPSRFEGFGWPIAEAQACGCPVLTSKAAPMSEIAGDAALLRDVNDEDGFAEDLLRLRSAELRAKYRALGLQNAARFSARKMAERYVALYRELGAAA
ncbi:MAG: glycosyltransferase family 4 protein [Verrucomicrobia bacterium]|nr:glycosyltransferase family 4 protein [Verrucomicrobiota bacterium]